MNGTFPICLIAISALLAACGTERAPSDPNSAEKIDTAAKNVTQSPRPSLNDTGEFLISETGAEKASPKPGKANIQGRIFYNGQPVANNEVKLCLEPNMYSDCIGEKHIARTDADGVFLLADLEPKIYKALFIRVFETRDYIFVGRLGFIPQKIKTEADKTFFVALTNLFKTDLKIENPKPKSSVDAQNFEMKWNAYPGAAYYLLELMAYSTRVKYLDGARTETTGYKIETPLINDDYRLRIQAYNSYGLKLAQNGDGTEFSITNGTLPNSNASQPCGVIETNCNR